MVGHQTPFLAAVVPLFLVLLVDGRRGLKQIWPLALVVGIAFGLAQYVSATFLSVELTDIIASLVGLAAVVIMLRFWKPKGGQEALDRMADEREHEGAAAPDAGSASAAVATDVKKETAPLTGSRVVLALFPYLLVIAIFSVAKLVPVLNNWLASTDVKIPWPGLDGNIFNSAGEVSTSTVYNFQWLSSPGTLLLISGIIVAIVYKMSAKDAVDVFIVNVVKMKFSILTVGSVLALAYVMNLSGQTITIGTWIAGTGAFFAFLSPILGWLGTAVTGSDTSANALFATLQQTAAHEAGLNPLLLVGANSSGGVLGKMVSPQNLTIAATAVGLLGKEASILRRVIGWSLGMLVAMCLLVGLQSTVLSWMVPSH